MESLSPSEIRTLKVLLQCDEIQDILKRHRIRSGVAGDEVFTDLREAIKDAGGIEAFAKVMKLSKSTVVAWLGGYSGISKVTQKKIYTLSSGRYDAYKFKEISKRNTYQDLLDNPTRPRKSW